MIPMSKKEIIDAIEMFEPRVEIQSVQHRVLSDKVVFDIVMNLAETDEVIKYTYELTEPGISRRLFTLLITAKDGLRYFVKLTIDGIEYSGLSYGYENINELWSWIKENWGNLGNWHFLQTRDQILLYVLAKKASLFLEKLYGDQAPFPDLVAEEFYVVRVGDKYSIDGLNTKDAVLIWVQENWSDIGEWMTDGKYLILSTAIQSPDLEIFTATAGDFNDDFDNNFSI